MKNKLSKFFSLAMLMSCLAGFVVGCGEGGPNPGPGGITATPGTFRYEFEECEMTDGAEPLRIEGTDKASNGACVAYFRAGAVLKFTIESTHEEANVPLLVCASSCVEIRDPNTHAHLGTSPVKGELLSQLCYVNGAPVNNWVGAFSGSGAGDEYGSMPNLEWYNFAVVSSTINLKAGQNVIEFRGTNAAMNWDYIEMTTSLTELSMEVQDDVGGDIGGW